MVYYFFKGLISTGGNKIKVKDMDAIEIRKLRLYNNGLSNSPFKTVSDAVSHFRCSSGTGLLRC